MKKIDPRLLGDDGELISCQDVENGRSYMKLAYGYTDGNGIRKIIIRRIPYAELVESTNGVEKEEV